MNKFQFELMRHKIDTIKRVVDLKALIYTLPIVSWWNIPKVQEENIYRYKTLSKALSKWETMSKVLLPKKYYTGKECLQSRIIEVFTRSGTPVSAREAFLDIFEHDKSIIIPYLNPEQLKTLITVIGTEPLPFRVTTEISVSVFEESKFFYGPLAHYSTYIFQTWLRLNNISQDHTLVKILEAQFAWKGTTRDIQIEKETLTQRRTLLQHVLQTIELGLEQTYE